jgi:glycerol-3-phosphate O-acyltransferase/dihydroxyacetone phosphate acyltransferase
MSLALDTTATRDRTDRLYRAVRAVARFWLWFFFKAVDVRHPERVPEWGPVLLCINHPNNVIDSLLVGGALGRKVHYLATAALFRHRLVGRFLAGCGAIPVYRKEDAPGAAALAEPAATAERNAATFAACREAFERGRVVAIYPEGTTHAETRVVRIKTGAARMALAYDAERPGALRVVPVGLTFEARKSFRGRVLVSFGPPVPVTPYLDAYRADGAKGVEALTTAIQWAMEAEVVHVERIEASDLVRAVEELYRGDLARELMEARGLAPDRIDLVRLSRAIVDAVNHFRARDPERVERLWQRIQSYRALLAEYRVKDEAVRARLASPGPRRRIRRGWEAVAGFPVFVYGACVNAAAYWPPRWIARGMSRKETDYATWRFLASIVAYPLFWGLETWLVWRLAGASWAAAFAVSLPLSGVLAYRYWVGAGRLRSRLRFASLALTREHAARRLVVERQEILAELERAKTDYLSATKGSSF